MTEAFKNVNKAVTKFDAMSNLSGKPVYTADFVPENALTIKLLRSPYAFAKIRSIDKTRAMAVKGVECILTHEDMPMHRHSVAGAMYPDNNPLDRRILDSYVRYVGDPVAIVAAKTPEAAIKALKLIKVDYEVLSPVVDFETAEGHESTVHPEDNFVFPVETGGDLKNNILLNESCGNGDFESKYDACPYKLDRTYYTGKNQQAMMEPFKTYSYIDEEGRIVLISSTQIAFHARRLISFALGIPESKMRIIKPRVGGGFGAKQTVVSETYAAAVTYFTKKPAYIEFSRSETEAFANTRHRFRIRVRLGAELDGTVKALRVDSLEDAGAYGEHSVNVVGLSGHKTIPLYAKAEDWYFTTKVVYTNTVPGGAFRGFGATQGCFAVESTVNEMCKDLKLDPNEVRLKNIPEVGKPMSAYYNEPLYSCALDRCIKTGADMIGWDKNRASAPFTNEVAPGVYRGVGMAVTMQGSGLTNIDKCAVTLSLTDKGYVLDIGASDIGTGCDTILAQMAAEVLECDTKDITTRGVDTDSSPFDKGSYASSTTYVTGNAVVRAANNLLAKMEKAARESACIDDSIEARFDGKCYYFGDKSVTLSQIAEKGTLSDYVMFMGKVSPPPFVAGFAVVSVDTNTGFVHVDDIVGVVDCGTVINKALAKVQAEGGFAQGIAMALTEDTSLDANGKIKNDNFMLYKIPSRLDVPKIRIAFEESYEPTGPFGAKSIGEVVINTPSPAIADAIRNAVGVNISSLPIKSEEVYKLLKKGE